MDAVASGLTAHAEHVTDVFQLTTPVYLRRRIAGMDKIVLVRCAGSSSGRLVMQWPDNPASGSPPRETEEVTCQALVKGVLYVAKGIVDQVTAGKAPRLHIKTGEHCIAVPLRKSPRYQVSGCLQLMDSDPTASLCQNNYCSMNISLGGFGIELPREGWVGADEVHFALDLMVERNGQPDLNLPGVRLEGEGLVRRKAYIPEHNTTYLGIQFTKLDEDQQGALEFWLAAHNSYLRSA